MLTQEQRDKIKELITQRKAIDAQLTPLVNGNLLEVRPGDTVMFSDGKERLVDEVSLHLDIKFDSFNTKDSVDGTWIFNLTDGKSRLNKTCIMAMYISTYGNCKR